MKKKFRLLNYLTLIIIVIQFARLLYRNFQHLKPLLQTIELQNPTIFIASAHAILTKPYSKHL